MQYKVGREADRNCRYSSTAGYSKRESPGRKATDGANAKRKHSRKISLGNEKGRDGESAT